MSELKDKISKITSSKWFKIGAPVLGALLFFYLFIWQWLLCRTYVPPGQMLVLNAKMGDENPDPNIIVVKEGVMGIQEHVLGEGRHFYNPVIYERMDAKVITIGPKEVGVVESLSGKGGGGVLVEPGYKGVLRKPLTPGSWRLNPYAYKVTKHKAVEVPPGYVGCVTSQFGPEPEGGGLAGPKQKGIQKNVLQPGIYYLNPKAFRVDLVEVGYRYLTLNDVKFKSQEGADINMDVTVVWGLHPVNVPHVMRQFFKKDMVEEGIKPAVRSVCEKVGKRYSAKEFIEGKTRKEFMDLFTTQLRANCENEMKIHVLVALVRDIDVPEKLRRDIIGAAIAAVREETRIEQQVTKKEETRLVKEKGMTTKEVQETEAETRRFITKLKTEGARDVEKIKGQQAVAVREVIAKVRQIEAERRLIVKEAKTRVQKAITEARADRLRLLVDAMGGPRAYAQYEFAQGLPKDLKIFVRYAGPGTFWTDLPDLAKSVEKAAATKILQK